MKLTSMDQLMKKGLGPKQKQGQMDSELRVWMSSQRTWRQQWRMQHTSALLHETSSMLKRRRGTWCTKGGT